MTGYQRFVAYVYEYKKEKKGENRGFVKVESKAGKCRMDIQLRCQGMTEGIACRVFGFIREKQGLKGILLWETQTVRDGVKSSREFKSETLGGKPYRLEDFGGMVLLLPEGGFYGTEWDDLPIKPESFWEEGETEQDTGKEENQTTEQQEELPAQQKMIRQEGREEREQEELASEAGETVREEENKEESKERNKKDTLAEDTGWETAFQVEAAQICEKEVYDSTEYPAFTDGEILHCRKIEPGEFRYLNRRDWPLRNNRFLQYGYYHFGYLIIGKMRESGKYILGVPGVYDQQERFMANMFGFPHFKVSKTVQVPEGKGGYWYRLIHTPDGCGGNGK